MNREEQLMKKTIKELLSIVAIVIAFVLIIPAIAQAKVKATDIDFPGNFYTKEIKSCKAMGDTSFDLNYNINHVKGLIGYDWTTDHNENSNSLTVNHDAITGPIKTFLEATHNAIGNGNEKNIAIAKDLAVAIAKADTLYDSIGYHAVKKKPNCWKNSDVNAKCWYHEYQFARDVFGNYMIGAIWLKPYMTDTEFKVVDKYIKKMYKKFLAPKQGDISERGFYQNANGGIPILLYASWTENKKLAASEINTRFKEINKLYYKDGYINNNTFRGVRAQWYHSYGHNAALGYVYIAQLWGAQVPEKLMNKLIKASEVVNLAILDREKFLDRKFTGKYNGNKTEDPAHARWHTHQDSIAIDTLMLIVTDVKMVDDHVWEQKRDKTGMDDTISFNPNCIAK